jgi:hypothetical protein
MLIDMLDFKNSWRYKMSDSEEREASESEESDDEVADF